MTENATPLPGLLSVATALPPHVLRQDDVAALMRGVFRPSMGEIYRLMPVYTNAAIAQRHSCVPLDWYAEPHGFKERNDLYVQNALDVLEEAGRAALARAGVAAAEVDTVVAVSSSGIATPSLDALILGRLGLRPDVERLPVFGLGCAGGVIGLARAARMAAGRPGAVVLFLVVELCGLTFRVGDHSKSNVIATALFGDGAAAAVLRAGGETDANAFLVSASGEYTWPRSLKVMGWNVEDDGFGVLFSADIPAIIRRDYRDALDRFLAANGLELGDIDGFALHPGGAKVIDALEEVLEREPGSLAETRAVLGQCGNMSAATVMFVLERMLARRELPRRILVSSLGPGFTVGFTVLERP